VGIPSIEKIRATPMLPSANAIRLAACIFSNLKAAAIRLVHNGKL
jgi:hypothetical protein